jgi:hypothetical protein
MIGKFLSNYFKQCIHKTACNQVVKIIHQNNVKGSLGFL